MDHDPGIERLRRQCLECGEVSIDVRDLEGLRNLVVDAGFDALISRNTFSSHELAVITGSEFRVRPETATMPRTAEASVSYLIDRHGSSVEEDLYDIYDHLVTRLHYDQLKFDWSPRVNGSHILTYQLDNELVAAITVDDLTDGTTLQEYAPGAIILRIAYENETSGPVLDADLITALRLWGDLHDAVSYPNRGKHAERDETPVVIRIGPFQPTDDMLIVNDVLMKYKQDRETSDETWPELDLASIDPQDIIDRLDGVDEDRLRAALALLLVEYRAEYGRSGFMPTIDGPHLLDAIARLTYE